MQICCMRACWPATNCLNTMRCAALQVPWPLSIAAPEAALAQYQMVFRHIFELKWVERELTRVVALYQQTTGLASRRARLRRASLGGGGAGASDALAASLAQSYSACQVMTHFFRQYLMYVTFEVMEPLWGAFEAKVQTASSLDEVSVLRVVLVWAGDAVGARVGCCCMHALAASCAAPTCSALTSHLSQPLTPALPRSRAVKFSPTPLPQIVEQHKAFLRRLMKGCLLSRKVVVLRALLSLKELALRFVKISDEAAALKWEALEEEAEQKCMGGGAMRWAVRLQWRGGCLETSGLRWKCRCCCHSPAAAPPAGPPAPGRCLAADAAPEPAAALQAAARWTSSGSCACSRPRWRAASWSAS